jgi:dolichyl-phosphate beta-glucosyltransferase
MVIPAYNEAKNLRNTLQTAWSFLAAQEYETELLIVDDGSEDSTAEVARDFARDKANIRLISIPHGGKAAALRTGMSAATGEHIVFSDADLATPLTYIGAFRESVKQGCDVVIGSREGIGAERIGEPKYRHIMGRAFNLMVQALVLPGLHDTQCGFKLFNREVVTQILPRTRLYRDPNQTIQGARVTAFDVELLVISKRLGFKVCDMPVVWSYGKGSKVNPIRDTWANLVDVLTVKVNDIRGRYR